MKSNTIKNIIVIVLSFIPIVANAAIFVASNYEECVSDGKVVRTNVELKLLMDKCRADFPKLPKLYALKNAEISCIDADKKSTTSYAIIGDKVFSKGRELVKSEAMPITYRKKSLIVFSGIKIDIKDEGKKVAASTLDILNGILNIQFDAYGEHKSFDFDCIEK